MADQLWLIPALPLMSFLILVFFGKKLGRGSGVLATAAMGLSALVALIVGISSFSALAGGEVITKYLWTWFNIGVGDFSEAMSSSVTLYVDSLAMVFVFVITFVGFLIHWFSTEYMEGDEEYPLFFAYMNLFVVSMLMLVMSDDLLMLFFGWEGVGLCSYLLIGFWYKENYNNYAARKAFIVTRVGDVMMLLGLFLLVRDFNSLNIQYILDNASTVWSTGDSNVVWATILLLGGALGKSAQLPLQTWLPDAMAGPTPVSALIHAATMVTAGVYLISRMHALYEMAPVVQTLVAVIGALTLVIAGFAAMAQNDIKKVLAYSTISQIGYMFLALGVGAWSAGVFHFMTHAFFKALLFLGAGAVILAMHHEQDMFKMGGLRKKIPVVYWTFLAGSAALASIPLITAGFYSKDAILFYAFASDKGSLVLWVMGFVGAFITAFYTFRMVFLTFFGEAKMEVDHQPRMSFKVPLAILAVLSLIAGFVDLPAAWGNFSKFSDFVGASFKHASDMILPSNWQTTEIILQLVTGAVALVGVFLAYKVYGKNDKTSYSFEQSGLYSFFRKGWMFDQLFDAVLVNPIVWLSKIDKHDFIDKIYEGIGTLNLGINNLFSRTQNGYLRFYVGGIALGAVIALTIALLI